jgi:hypothetical protein
VCVCVCGCLCVCVCVCARARECMRVSFAMATRSIETELSAFGQTFNHDLFERHPSRWKQVRAWQVGDSAMHKRHIRKRIHHLLHETASPQAGPRESCRTLPHSRRQRRRRLMRRRRLPRAIRRPGWGREAVPTTMRRAIAGSCMSVPEIFAGLYASAARCLRTPRCAVRRCRKVGRAWKAQRRYRCRPRSRRCCVPIRGRTRQQRSTLPTTGAGDVMLPLPSQAAIAPSSLIGPLSPQTLRS